MASVTPSPTSQSDELHQALLKLTANSGVMPKKLEQAERSIRILLLEAQREELEYSKLVIWHLDSIRYIDKRIAFLDAAITKMKGDKTG